MTREQVIKKVAGECLDIGLIQIENYDILYSYLSLAYGAGYDRARRNQHPGKMIGQYDEHGQLLKIWESASAAGRALDIWESNIRRCANGQYRTAGGFQWRHIDQATYDEVETIKTQALKSTLPEQGTHVSKISSV